MFLVKHFFLFISFFFVLDTNKRTKTKKMLKIKKTKNILNEKKLKLTYENEKKKHLATHFLSFTDVS